MLPTIMVTPHPDSYSGSRRGKKNGWLARTRRTSIPGGILTLRISARNHHVPGHCTVAKEWVKHKIKDFFSTATCRCFGKAEKAFNGSESQWITHAMRSSMLDNLPHIP